MKMLFYNWDYVDGSLGGGVTVYQRNLIQYLLSVGKYEIYVLNSGLSYDMQYESYIRTVDNKINPQIHSYEIMNSPVIAPVQQSALNIDKYLHDSSLFILLREFIQQQKGFDVIHFNNLEGLSLQVLRLKEIYPQTKFIYSAHNYFPFCSRVNLWKDKLQKKGHMCDKKDSAACVECYYKLNYEAEIIKRICSDMPDIDAIARVWSKRFPDKVDSDLYDAFEKNNIMAINRYMDQVLAVSERVKQIFVSKGIREDKIQVAYIGTKVAEQQIGRCVADVKAEPFRMIYMGYMKEEKGFYFLLHALQKMPANLAMRMIVTIAARHDDTQEKEIQQLYALKAKFQDIVIINGYTSATQKSLLCQQNLGVVPVLWEDNLPQVAVEQVANGVPVLSSDRGGTAELCNYNPYFVFQAGNVDDYLSKLEDIVKHRKLLVSYWENVCHLTTMQEHVIALDKIYGA